jgi:phenylacetic acid degradation operon negative regulatory protein
VIVSDAGTELITPRRLILELLDADPELMGRSRRLLLAGGVFGFSANQVRVALSRLVSDGLLANPSRGSYALTGAGAAMREEIQRWRHIEDQLCEWRGGWCVLMSANLAAESSTRLRAQTRALRLRGLRRWRSGLWVRPANLQGGIERLGNDVVALGLDSIDGSFLIEGADSRCEDDLLKLWDTHALREDYERNIATVQCALARLDQEQQRTALAETLELGGAMIRALLTDPLLPESMLGSDARGRLITLVKQYDAAGRERWRHFINHLEQAVE